MSPSPLRDKSSVEGSLCLRVTARSPRQSGLRGRKVPVVAGLIYDIMHVSPDKGVTGAFLRWFVACLSARIGICWRCAIACQSWRITHIHLFIRRTTAKCMHFFIQCTNIKDDQGAKEGITVCQRRVEARSSVALVPPPPIWHVSYTFFGCIGERQDGALLYISASAVRPENEIFTPFRSKRRHQMTNVQLFMSVLEIWCS